jgi:16S rRNA (guanine966-N2)-methyltransferase
MRVVAGEARGRRLIAPEGADTRPTSDRVREAIFNSLNSMDMLDDARVLDLFAGSGAMGIEALSRYAAHCTFVERARPALDAIRENLRTTGLEDKADVLSAEAANYVSSGRAEGFDLILADPPYAFTEWAVLLAGIPAGLVVGESNKVIAPPSGWESLRERRYGLTWVTFLQRV